MATLHAIDPWTCRADLLKLWNCNLSSSFPLGEPLFLQGLGPEKEERACLVAYDEVRSGDILGFALVKGGVPGEAMAPRTGNLSLLLVDAKARRKGLGGALLEASEAWLRDRGAVGILAGADRRHFFPGIPLDKDGKDQGLSALLTARGYQAEALEHDLLGPALAGLDEAPEGLAWVYASAGYREAGEAFFLKNFPGRWTSEFLDFLDSGRDPRDLILLLETATNRILGFCRLCRGLDSWLQPGLYWSSLLEGKTGALGPIGIDAGQRGRGLGLALLRRGLQELGASGADQVVIDWTDQVGFYAPLGFRIWKTYQPRWKRL